MGVRMYGQSRNKQHFLARWVTKILSNARTFGAQELHYFYLNSDAIYAGK